LIVVALRFEYLLQPRKHGARQGVAFFRAVDDDPQQAVFDRGEDFRIHRPTPVFLRSRERASGLKPRT